VHGDIARQDFVPALHADQRADARAVHVSADPVGRTQDGGAAHVDLLANLGDQVPPGVVHGCATREREPRQRLGRGLTGGERRGGDTGSERLELRLACHEVRLAIDLDEHRGAAVS